MPEEIDKVRRERLKLLFDTLAAAGITTVTIRFDGCGDSGQIEDTTVEPEGRELPTQEIRWVEGQMTYTATDSARIEDWGRKWDFNVKAGPVEDLLEVIVYDYMEKEHLGWENNDGAFGEFIFDVSARTVHYEHNTRFTDSSLDVHEYKEE